MSFIAMDCERVVKILFGCRVNELVEEVGRDVQISTSVIDQSLDRLLLLLENS
jgi:hypothetical protein